ncbi:MAG: RNA polymerase sigma factor [Solirubrobacteraceae bacterium]
MSLLAGESTERRAESPNTGLLGDFERLYRTQVGPVTAYFARRSREPQTVADLTADTFLEAMRSFASFDPRRGDVRPWLFAIARHVYARHSERGTRERDAAARHGGRRSLDPDETEELERRIDAAQRGREIVDRLGSLPPLDREAIELVDLAELTPKEAARVLGVSSGGLRVRLSRARARLRKEYGINV